MVVGKEGKKWLGAAAPDCDGEMGEAPGGNCEEEKDDDDDDDSSAFRKFFN